MRIVVRTGLAFVKPMTSLVLVQEIGYTHSVTPEGTLRSMRIMSVADAIAALDYLHKRELLCERCGITLATVRSPNHAYCAGCRPVHGDYAAVVPANRLEKWLCDSLQEWLNDADASEK